MRRRHEHLVGHQPAAACDHAESDAGTPAGNEALAQGFAAHERVVELIEAKDAGKAERLWRKHLLAADDYLLGGAQALTVYDLMG